jgi:hypothetical protein
VQFVDGFRDNSSVMFRQPVSEKVIWYLDRNRFAAIGDKCRRFEPGVETMAVYLRLDPSEDSIPQIFGHFEACIGAHADTDLTRLSLFECTGTRDIELNGVTLSRCNSRKKVQMRDKARNCLITFVPCGDGATAGSQKPSNFHTFFHRCGKL